MKFAMTALVLGCAGGASFAASVETETRATAAYYTSGYDGAELRLAAYRCVAPVFPSVSTTPDGVRKVEKSIKAWQAANEAYAHSQQHATHRAPEMK